MRRRWALAPVAVCLALFAFASTASASTVFHPRVKNALGLIPPVNSQGNFNTEPTEGGVFTPVVYHGGSTMTGGVHVHLIFWAPPGFSFQGSPGTGIPTYEGMLEQYYTDVATASSGSTGGTCTTAACNDFTVEPQYGFGLTPGGLTSGDNTITFNNSSATFSGTGTLPAGTDVIHDTDPYNSQCTSPQDTKACIFDSQLQAEVDNVVQHTSGTPRGLHDLWYVFLPPDVDECITQDVCGTNAFGGYHSLSNLNGHGLTIYALTIDPIIEVGAISPGADPQGNPDAEVAVDIADHETNEAMTDPEGVGWMDPNGFEVGDKCEFGPAHGTPLGFAPDGSPFNQVIHGHQYLTQEMWSQADSGCVQSSTKTLADSGLPLPRVNLTQFSSTVTGNTENNTRGIGVQVSLVRTDINGNPIVISGSTTTASDGSWSVTLPGHTVGDDRDEIDIDYSGAGAPSPNHQVILTGNGGNPFLEAGWTGWTDLDNGYGLTNSPPSLTIGPCFQTGTESYTVNGTVGAESPTDFCSTSADTATAPLSGPVGPGHAVTITTNDNRAFQPTDSAVPNTSGGMVNLTIPAGEPDSVSSFANPLSLVTGEPFTPTGFPTCSADLTAQVLTCSGLVPGNSYGLTDGGQHVSGSADGGGTLSEPMTIHRGDSIALSNGARTLTTLGVADLQVSVNDANPGTVASGSCSPDQWTGGPLDSVPVNFEAGGPGAALSGAACPSNGDATGMPTSSTAQTDERTGGQTVINLPDIADTSPLSGETLYGGFIALAESTGAALPIAVSIAPAAGGSPVFTAGNTDTANGVAVPALKTGTYKATWTVKDPNGDTRILTTRFIEEPAVQGAQGPPGPRGPRGPRGPQGPPGPKPKVSCKLVHHGKKIRCKVTFPKAKKTKGKLQVRIARGGHVAALGAGRVNHGAATLTMREIRRITHGAWTITLVLSQPHKAASTTRMKLRVT